MKARIELAIIYGKFDKESFNEFEFNIECEQEATESSRQKYIITTSDVKFIKKLGETKDFSIENVSNYTLKEVREEKIRIMKKLESEMELFKYINNLEITNFSCNVISQGYSYFDEFIVDFDISINR